MLSAQRLTDASDPRLSSYGVTRSMLVQTLLATRLALYILRQAMTTLQSRMFKHRVISVPIPPLAPVTKQVLPARFKSFTNCRTGS